MLRNTLYSYGSVAKFLHWLIALLVIGMLAVGLFMTGMENGPDKFRVYGLHKSTGIMVLLLVAVRLMWKCVNPRPLLPATLHRLEKFLAHAGHVALYALMVAMPLTGWAMSSAAGFPVSVFGLGTLPDFVPPDREMHEFWEETHELLAWVLIVMIALHVLAALLHHFYYKNNILRRMLPFTKEEPYARISDTAAGC